MNSSRKTAIATGASQGIGAGIVEGFVERGFNVVANFPKGDPIHRGRGFRLRRSGGRRHRRSRNRGQDRRDGAVSVQIDRRAGQQRRAQSDGRHFERERHRGRGDVFD
jgi:NAD(P)-dependent dehydrogenase (short-subunit alcohol dehydrogenase family)